MKKHANISIFVPHIGCKNRCSFCNQNIITGKNVAPDADYVHKTVSVAVSSKNFDPNNTEIAFFGGSFTAIEKDYMIKLLSAAYTYVENKTVKGIRISTRPDAIDFDILKLLRDYGVGSIELGAQSTDDEVLSANKRGHTFADIINACDLIRCSGFELGLQMMTGLYKSDRDKDLKTADDIIRLSPSTVRVYPTVVLKNTLLERLFSCGEYSPPSLDESVELCSEILQNFHSNNISIIRMGLHAVEMPDYIAGPWHPAFRELCESQIYFKIACSLLNEKGDYRILVNPKSVSKMVGQSGKNIDKLKVLGYNCRVCEDGSLNEFEVVPQRV
ncbi:MAG: radical SAM protein [bacterium]|nr:radical SAM protein [bacterium]